MLPSIVETRSLQLNGKSPLSQRQAARERALLMAVFARMDGVAMALAVGTVSAVGLFVATIVLLLKGAPPGVPIGPNLATLGNFLPGYSVSWIGSIIGAGYAAVIGLVGGYLLAVLWNFTHLVYIGVVIIRGQWFE